MDWQTYWNSYTAYVYNKEKSRNHELLLGILKMHFKNSKNIRDFPEVLNLTS